MRRGVRWARTLPFITLALLAGILAWDRTHPGTPVAERIVAMMRGQATVEDRLREYGPAVRTRLAPDFQQAGVAYPPRYLVLLGLKAENRLEVYAGESERSVRLIRSYPVLAASGGPGPKLRYGDRQVPEGLYRIDSLHPNSRFHLSLRVNYPNEFDRAQAAREGRENLGGDIMIHGSDVSIGCLAVGDEAAEDLFVLAADTGLENTRVVLSPVDFRVRSLPPRAPRHSWSETLYRDIRSALRALPPA